MKTNAERATPNAQLRMKKEIALFFHPTFEVRRSAFGVGPNSKA
jgi:hypothetical protein